MSKLNFEMGDILKRFFLNHDVYGFTVIEPGTLENGDSLENIYTQEVIDFTTLDTDEDTALGMVRTSARIRLANFVVAGLINRETSFGSPEEGLFAVGDLRELANLPEEVKTYDTTDVRMRHTRYLHNGGYVWCEGNLLHIGFKP